MLSRARTIAREEGLASLWFKLLGEIVYRRGWVVELPLRRSLACPAVSPPDLEIAELASAELDAYGALRPESDLDEIRSRLAAGDRCFAARRAGRLLHAVWVSTSRCTIEYLGRTLPLDEGDAYVYEAYSALGMRRREVSVAVADELARRLGAEGRRRILGVVMPENRAGAAAAAAWGYRRRGTLRTVRFGRHRLHFGAFPPPAPALDESAYWSSAIRRLEDGRHYLDPFLGRMKRERHLRLVRDWCSLDGSSRVLKTDAFEEAGGPDALAADLAREVGALHVIDISPGVIRRAATRHMAVAARWTVADVRCLPFPDDYFSAIVSTSTLDHFRDPADLRRSLRELRRVLRPGARLVITLDNRENVFDPLLRLAHRLGRLPYFVGRGCSTSELRAELADVGFEVGPSTTILHNPRLVAVSMMRLARASRLAFAVSAAERLLTAAQRLEGSRWRRFTGSFVAAVAVRPRAAKEPGAA